jgi:hypothetical protein
MVDGPDHQLRHKVDMLANLVSRIDDKVDLVNQGVDTVNATQLETRNDLSQLRAEFQSFVMQAERTANVQRAETRLGVIRDQVEHEFGHHKVVRRSATGILQAFDVGLVSEKTVREISEQLMVQTPRYWLAPALVGLAAWSGDDQALCTRALEEGFRRSPTRTSLFFALVTRRQSRMDASARWLRHYLSVLDPSSLGRDFAVVLESVSQGAFGAAGREMVQEVLGDWREQLLTDEVVIAAQVERWRKEISSRRTGSATDRFPRLAEVSPQWPQLDAALASAGAHQGVHTEYAALLKEEIHPSERIEDAVDDILDRLVTEYDNDELPLRRELALNTAIVETNGDLSRAQEKADLDTTALEETLDYLTIQTTSALHPSSIGVSRATQRIAVSACSDWFRAGHDEFSRAYRASIPSDVTAAFDTTHSVGAQTFSLPRWSASFTLPLRELEGSFVSHWDRHVAPFIDSMRFDWKKKSIIPAVVMVIVAIILTTMGVAGFFVALIAGGIWAFVIYRQYEASVQAVAAAEKMLAKMKQDSVQQLRGAAAELNDWQGDFEKADEMSVAVQELIYDYSTAGQSFTPYEKRVVMAGSEL